MLIWLKVHSFLGVEFPWGERTSMLDGKQAQFDYQCKVFGLGMELRLGRATTTKVTTLSIEKREKKKGSEHREQNGLD